LYPVIIDSYLMGVLPQVFYNLLRIAKGRLTIHNPGLSPEVIEQGLILRQKLALFELSFEFFEHFIYF
jgi:hypothetical protein